MIDTTSTILNVFVYGTLRKGWGLHRFIEMFDGVYLGTEKLVGYRMHSLGAFPAINKVDDWDSYVVGEIYSFEEKDIAQVLRVLDRIELGAGYRRCATAINGKDVWLYVYPHSLAGFKEMIDWSKEMGK